MKIHPLGDRILIRRLEEVEQVSGGIIIPDTAQEKPSEGVVVSVGSGARGKDGKNKREGVCNEGTVSSASFAMKFVHRKFSARWQT